MGDSPSSDSGSNNESRMSPGRATAQFGAEVGSLAGGYTETQVQDAIDQNELEKNILGFSRTPQEIAADAPIPTNTGFSASANDRENTLGVLPQGRMTQIEQLDERPNFFSGGIYDKIPNVLTSGLNYIEDIAKTNIMADLASGRFDPVIDVDGRVTGSRNPTTGILQSGMDFNAPMDMGDDGGGNEQTLIRRNANDPVDEREEERPPVSDDLAVNYLQNPFYLYSGQGNLFQPYGYANNTLVDLLRTRNLTQPQQAAANLGLFGNPGDFS
mgnify:CR=1 FL=1